MKLFPPEFEPLQAVLVAALNEAGELLEANAGFFRVIASEGSTCVGMNVTHFFLQPNFVTLVTAPADEEGVIHQGLLTIGDYMGRTRTVVACIRRAENKLLLIAEFDINELERFNETVKALNVDYANAQLELAQSNFKLKQHQIQLEKLMTEVEFSNQQLKQMHAKLLQTEKMAAIGQLAAGVAHEINNPIGFVSSNLSTLNDYMASLFKVLNAYEHQETSSTEKEYPALGKLKKELEYSYLVADIPNLLSESSEGLARVTRIVQDLKSFSHVGESAWQYADIEQGIESTLNIINNEIKFKAELVKEFAGLPKVQCVPSEINQVLMNLLLNAAQAIQVHGVITVRTGMVGEEVWIEVTDTGQGIAPENLAHIFEPFFTTKPVGKGTGLGLSVSYTIVEKHHGKIEVQSDVGKGTTFKVWLPVQPSSLSRM